MSEENPNTEETTDPLKEAAKELEEELTENKEPTLEEKLEKAGNDFLYLKAEFDNFRKRSIKERSDYIRYGSAPVFVSFLEVMDNFDRALETDVTPENLETFLSGIKMISQEMHSLFERFSVQEVPSLGETFDPNMHQALSTEKTAAYEAGKISQVFTKPYKLHDKVLRPGQVVIAEAPNSEEE